nr:hypothetical protein [uncultured bacterium]
MAVGIRHFAYKTCQKAAKFVPYLTNLTRFRRSCQESAAVCEPRFEDG